MLFRSYALNTDGTEKWKYRMGDEVWSSPVLGQDGTVYIGSYDDHLYAISKNGTVKWKFKIGRASCRERV